MLEGEELARAAKSGLDLVDAEERPVPAAQLLRALQIAVRREVHALPLDWLDEEHRDVLGSQGGLECIQVAERDT